MLKRNFTVILCLLFLSAGIAYGQNEIPIDNMPSHGGTPGVVPINKWAKYWLSWFAVYYMGLDSVSRYETKNSLNRLQGIYQNGIIDSAQRPSENGVATPVADYISLTPPINIDSEKQTAIYLLVNVGICDPTNTPANALLPLLKNNAMHKAEAHRNVFRTLEKKSDSIYVATLCDIILNTKSYPGKDTSILDTNNKVIKLYDIAVELLKPLTENRVKPSQLVAYRKARSIALGETFVCYRTRLIYNIQPRDMETCFDLLGRKVTGQKYLKKFRIEKTAGRNMKIIF